MARYLKLFLRINLLALFVSSCATLESQKPLDTKTYTFPASYQDVWEVTLETLNAELVPIANQNMRQGVITSAQFPIQKNEFRKWAEDTTLAPSGYGTLYLTVIRQDGEVSKLQIASDFQSTRRSVLRKKGQRHPSTGVFEDALAVRIHTYLIAKKYPALFQLVIGANFRWNETDRRYEVSGVESGSLGEEQGFQNRDRVLKIDGREVSINNFFSLLNSIKQNEIKIFTLERGGTPVELKVEIFYLDSQLPWFGFRIEHDPITGAFRIARVAAGSPAESAGFKAGDILVEEGGIRIENWRDYYRAMTEAKPHQERTFKIKRNGSELALTAKPLASQPSDLKP